MELELNGIVFFIPSSARRVPDIPPPPPPALNVKQKNMSSVELASLTQQNSTLTSLKNQYQVGYTQQTYRLDRIQALRGWHALVNIVYWLFAVLFAVALLATHRGGRAGLAVRGGLAVLALSFPYLVGCLARLVERAESALHDPVPTVLRTDAPYTP